MVKLKVWLLVLLLVLSPALACAVVELDSNNNNAVDTKYGGTDARTVKGARSNLGITELNAKSYGAAGNGTTSDVDEIQTIIDLLEARGGGILYLPAGDYLVPSSLTITGSGITIKGDGRRVTNIYFTATDGSPLFNVDATTSQIHNLHVRDISIYGSSPSAPTTGVATGTCFNTKRLVHSDFDNVDILYFNAGVAGGTSIGIKIMGDAIGNSYNLNFRNIYMFKTSIGFNFADDGAGEYNADIVNIHNYWFGAQDDTNNTYGIKVDGYLTNFSMTGNNVIYHCKYGIYFNGTSGTAGLVNWQINETRFEESGSYTNGVAAVFLKGNGEPGVGDYLREVSFLNCHFTDNWTKHFDLDYVYNMSIANTHLLSSGTSISATAHVDLTLSNIWNSGTLSIAAQKVRSVENDSGNILEALYISDRVSPWSATFSDPRNDFDSESVRTTGTGEQDLMSYTIIQNNFITAGNHLHINALFVKVNANDNTVLKYYLGANSWTLLDEAAFEGNLSVEVDIWVKGPTAQLIHIVCAGEDTIYFDQYVAGNVDFTAGNVVSKFTGNNDDALDIMYQFMHSYKFD